MMKRLVVPLLLDRSIHPRDRAMPPGLIRLTPNSLLWREIDGAFFTNTPPCQLGIWCYYRYWIREYGGEDI